MEAAQQRVVEFILLITFQEYLKLLFNARFVTVSFIICELEAQP